MLKRLNRNSAFYALLLGLTLPTIGHADSLNGANTAWIITATALVLFMTIPGLSLFYGGLVRVKNVLSILMQCFAITCAASLIWLICGYSLAFTDGSSMNSWIGGLDNFMLGNVMEDTLAGDIPESVFAMFQMTFAIITPALIIGAFTRHPLGLGRRLAAKNGALRFCRWYRSTCYGRYRRTGCGTGYW